MLVPVIEFSDEMMPADGIATSLETSARSAGDFQKSYTDLPCSKGGDGGFWPVAALSTCHDMSAAGES
jgi:hypothetical protein